MVSFTFDDPDEFRGQLADVTCDMWITGVQQRRWAYDKLKFPDLILQRGDLGSGNLVHGQASPNGFLVYILEDSHGLSRLDGSELAEGSAVVLRANSEFTFAHSHPHRWLSLYVANPLFRVPATISASGPQGLSAGIIQASRQIIPLAAASDRFVTSAAAQRAQRYLLRLLAGFAAGGRPGAGRPADQPKSRRGRPSIPRSMVLSACHAYLAEADLADVSLQGLLSHSGVSARMLRTIFQEMYGFGPKRFLQLRQLNRVHRDLRESDPTVARVTDILIRHGVWNFNHFGRRYRELFGEPPSNTLLSASGAG